MAGGSQILIDDTGITISTGGKILYQAGQHKFEGGERTENYLPTLSNLPIVKDNYLFTNRIDAFELFKDIEFSTVKYRGFLKNNKIYREGTLDANGRTERFTSIDNQPEELQVVIDDPNDDWLIIDNDFQD